MGNNLAPAAPPPNPLAAQAELTLTRHKDATRRHTALQDYTLREVEELTRAVAARREAQHTVAPFVSGAPAVPAPCSGPMETISERSLRQMIDSVAAKTRLIHRRDAEFVREVCDQLEALARRL